MPDKFFKWLTDRAAKTLSDIEREYKIGDKVWVLPCDFSFDKKASVVTGIYEAPELQLLGYYVDGNTEGVYFSGQLEPREEEE